MGINYPTVTIGGKTYAALATVEDADDYLAAEPSADAYRAGDADARGRWLVSSSRAILRQPLDPSQLGGPLVPAPLAEAAMLLAAALASGFDPAKPGGQQLRRQRAGSVEQDFYYDGNAVALAFPLPVLDLLRPLLLGGGSDLPGALALGVCAPSSFEDPFGTIYPGASYDDSDRFRRAFD